jgi:DNA-binding MarR family transcriptional regulator
VTTDLERLSGDLVMYAARLVRAVRRVVDSPAGVRVLSLLDELGPQGVSALATADRCSQPTMSGTVKGLLERGLVTKSAHPGDARSTLVDLTAAGRTELARIRRDNGHVVAERLAARHHTPEEVAQAVALLRDLLDPLTTEGTL